MLDVWVGVQVRLNLFLLTTAIFTQISSFYFSFSPSSSSSSSSSSFTFFLTF
ncbi:hypothetical protein Csa_010615 [Cucumis sativus]|nr:hypothetical protein Csa_010615 [Cucumis sativus]